MKCIEGTYRDKFTGTIRNYRKDKTINRLYKAGHTEIISELLTARDLERSLAYYEFQSGKTPGDTGK